MEPKRQYTAEDGLNVLNYLGIRISDQEITAFREQWDKSYQLHREDLIQTTWVLYAEALPFTLGDGDRGSFMLSRMRDSDFGERMETTKLDEELKQGINLQDILKKGPHKFFKSYPTE